MNASPETILVIIGIFLVFWYLGASIFNRRRGIATFKWLQTGLGSFGGEAGAHWLGSSGSGVQIDIHKAAPPFRQVEIVCLLATRELLPLFLINLLRDRRDRLIIKLTLRSTPQGEAEVVQARSPQAHQLHAEGKTPWQVEDLPHSLVLGARGRDSQTMKAALMPLIERHAVRLQSISWSKQTPHLIVVMALGGLYKEAGTAASLFDDLVAVAHASEKKA